MGLFSRLFGKKTNTEQQTENEERKILFAPNDDEMQAAYQKARDTFKYFWRELYWENRRIVKAHNMAMIKIRFEQNDIVEHMWVNEVEFDGEVISGILVNSPGQITNIKNGDRVNKSINELSDWMFVVHGESFGGFTIQTMRSKFKGKELKAHDAQWGIDFGDPNDILFVNKQKENPNNLIEHPMSINMGPQAKEFFEKHPKEFTNADPKGLTALHHEAIAGNKTNVEILINLGADKSIKSKSDKTPYEYAKYMGWDHILDLLK